MRNPSRAVPRGAAVDGFRCALPILHGTHPTWRRPISGKPGEGKPRNVMGGAPRDGEVGEDFADHRGELEAVPRTRRCHDDLGAAGQPVENEVAIRRRGVETGLGGEESAAGIGHVGFECGADHVLVGGRNGSIVVVGIDRLTGMVMLCCLDAIGFGRESVEDAVAILQEENRKASNLELRPRPICRRLLRRPVSIERCDA